MRQFLQAVDLVAPHFDFFDMRLRVVHHWSGVSWGLCTFLVFYAVAYAARMLMGTAQMLLETGEHPGALKDRVGSPAGSTIQGVRTLERRGFRAAVMDAVIASGEKEF